MFKVSQEIRLNTSGCDATRTNNNNHNNHNNHNNSNNSSSSSNNVGNNNSNSATENDCIFGRYQRTPDADAYPISAHQVFVAPELTDSSKIQILHFPNGALRINSNVNFVIKRNGVKGNFEVKFESPSGVISNVPLHILDPERLQVDYNLTQAGLYKVHIKCNSVPLPRSPFIIVSMCGEPDSNLMKIELPNFKSDATKVTYRGFGLTHICLNESNDFTVDGSEAGANILFVGIFGPKGQCDEVIIKHLGRNIYKVSYQVQDPGEYILAAKWGDEHIPGSPFCLSAM